MAGLRYAIGVDFDWKNQRIYWTDLLTDKIYSVKFDGSQEDVIITGGLMSAEGLVFHSLFVPPLVIKQFVLAYLGIAVDWIASNLYWLDARAKLIEVSKLDGSYRSVLISTDIDAPRALQIDPREG